MVKGDIRYFLMVKVSVRKIPYSLRYLPYGQGGHKVFPYGQR